MTKTTETEFSNGIAAPKKVGVLLATSVFLVSATVAPAAMAENPAGGGAFRDFKQNNPGIENKELRQMFRQQFNPGANLPSIAQPVIENIQSQPSITANVSNQLTNDLSRAELRAQKQLLQQEVKTAHQNLNKTLQDTGANFVNANKFALDLGSPVENITLGSNLFKDITSVTINVGGETKTLAAGSKVTAAEYIAAKQVLNAGGQKVTINESGSAVGGSVDLSALTSGNQTLKMDDLHISEGVTAYGDFGKGGDVRINGDLVNAGGIVAYSSSKNVTVANLRADNITNNAGASISSGLNAEQGGVVDNISLGLYANSNLSNFGSITSAGDITLSAGNNLNNGGHVVAQSNVNVLAPNVNNSGVISSVASNINIDSSIASNLSVNNINGTMSALNGAINLRSSDFNDAFDTNVVGGDLLSRKVNLNAGQGTANLDVKALTGEVTATGLAAHVRAETENLIIGKQCLIGDPTYYNVGDITINGDIEVGEKLAIIASGNVATSPGSINITARGGNQGYDIQIIAGADVVAGSGTATSVSGNPPAGNTSADVSFSGASESGGSVNFNGSVVTINANSLVDAGLEGGNVTVAAFSGSDVNSGRVLMPVTTINVAGTGTADTNGDVTILAGNIIQVGAIQNAYNINIANSQPVFSSGTSMTFDVTGTVTTGNSLVAGTITPNGTIALGAITGTTGDIVVHSGGNMTLSGIDQGSSAVITSDNGVVFATGAINVDNNSAITASGNVTLNDASAGTLGITSQNGTVTAQDLQSTVSTTIDASGNISVDDITGGSAFLTSNNGSITVDTITTTLGEVILDAANNILVTGNLLGGIGLSLTTDSTLLGSVTLGGTVSSRNISIVANDLSLQTIDTLALTTDPAGDSGALNLRFNNYNTSSGRLNLLAQGTGAGHGGNIYVIYNSGNPVDITTLAGGDFTFNASATGSGDAGSMRFESLGDVTIGTGGFTATGASGGFASVEAGGDVTVNGGISIAGTNGSGSGIVLSAGNDGAGSLFLNDTSYLSTANATGNNGDGGVIDLAGERIVYANNSATSPLVLSANGIGTGDGGFVSYSTGDVTALNIGAPAKPPKGPALYIETSATSGLSGGNGGVIQVATGGALSVNTSLATAGPQSPLGDWDGAIYRFAAGGYAPKGAGLSITGSLDASAVGNGSGGEITLYSAVKDAFIVGGTKAPKNGILGTLTANGDGGAIGIANFLGGVTITNQVQAEAISMVAGAKGAISTTGVGKIRATGILALAAQAGAIGSKAGLAVDTAALAFSTPGAVSISNTSLAIDAGGFAGSGFSLLTTGDANVYDLNTINGSINVKAAGAVQLGSMSTAAGSINVTAGQGNLTVINGSTITANNGSLTFLLTDTVFGNIYIEGNTVVETQGRGGQVTIAIGPSAPKKGVNPVNPLTAPFGMTVVNVGKGQVFVGTPVSVSLGGPVTVEAKNKNVVFNSVNNRMIILGDSSGPSRITADPPSPVASMMTQAPNSFVPAADNSSASSSGSFFGFASDNAIHTTDLTVFGVNSASTVQSAQTLALVTSSQSTVNAVKVASLQAATRYARKTNSGDDDDNSYMVGYANAVGETEAALCSDTMIGAQGIEDFVGNIQRIAHSSDITLKEGNVLFVPNTNTVVKTPKGNVHIAAKSIVLISTSPERLAVYDLDDQHKGSVSVQSGEHSVVLSPGRHVLVTDHHGAEFAQVNAIETVAHRNVTSTIKNGTRAHHSEFSIPSAFDTVAPLKAMVRSNHPEARKIAGRMMKTTAVVMHLGREAGQYQHYFKPRMTAMAK